MRAVGNQQSRQQVQAPAIGLLLTAILGMLTHIFIVGIYLVILAAPDFFQDAPERPTAKPGPAGAPASQPALADHGDTRLGAVICIVGGLVGICLDGLILFGALAMKNLRSYGMAMAASIVALVPTGPCCLLGLPMAIWALVTLAKPEIKTAFQ